MPVCPEQAQKPVQQTPGLPVAALLTPLGLPRRSRTSRLEVFREGPRAAGWGRLLRRTPPNGPAHLRNGNPALCCCSLLAGIAEGMSQRRRHHRHRRPQRLHRPQQPPPKSALEAEGQQPPARCTPPRQSLGQHGGDRWERAGARRDRGGGGAGKVKVRGRGAEEAGNRPGPCSCSRNPAPRRQAHPSQSPRHSRGGEGRVYPDCHTQPPPCAVHERACVCTARLHTLG